MTVARMTTSELKSRMGIAGRADLDFKVCFDTVEVLPAGWFHIDNPGQDPGPDAKAGDTFVIWSQTSVNPQRTLVGVNPNPFLVSNGSVSCPNFYTERFSGPVSVIWHCTNDCNLSELGYIVELFSLGIFKQNSEGK